MVVGSSPVFPTNIASSSNGRTPDFDSGYCGSNPCGATVSIAYLANARDCESRE